MSAAGRDAVFLHGPLMGHVVRMSTMASLGLMALFAVDLVDMIFISMLGNEALAAAVGYAGTVLFFTTSINIGFSIAAGSLAARALGAGDRELAASRASCVVLTALVLSLIVPVLVLMNVEAILALLGADGETARLARQYLGIVIPSMPLLGIAMCAMAVLRSHGDARRSMLATVGGGVVNAVLDPILIFGLGLELRGAAIATVCGRFAILLIALWPVLTRYRGFARISVAQYFTALPTVLGMALPAVLTNVATPIGSAIVTREMARFGSEAVAGMAVIGRLTPVAFALILALSGAIGPIVGQNAGANEPERVRNAVRDALLFTAVWVLFAAAVLFLLRQPIIELFSVSGEAASLVLLFCGPLALSYFFNGVVFTSNASFNNLGKPLYSTMINWGWHTLGTWPFVVVGASLYGARGVLIGQASGAVLFATVAMVLLWRVLGQQDWSVPTVNSERDPFEWHRRLHTIVSRLR